MSKTNTIVLIKEKDQLEFIIPTKNPNSEFAPDGTGKLIQEYDFEDREFSATYIPSEQDWLKGLVILKIDDLDNKESMIIEIKLVEYLFPANISINSKKYLKFRKHDKFSDQKMDLHFSFKLFYVDSDNDEYILMERPKNVFGKSPSLSILLSDNIIEEIDYIQEAEFKLMIQLYSSSKDFLDCTLEVELDKRKEVILTE